MRYGRGLLFLLLERKGKTTIADMDLRELNKDMVQTKFFKELNKFYSIQRISYSLHMRFWEIWENQKTSR